MFVASPFTGAERRDTRREDEALLWLRQQPEPFRLQFVTQIVAQGYAGAHEFIRRGQFSPRSLEELFRGGLLRADASTVRFWLAAVIAGLGWRRVIGLLHQHLATDAGAVEQALYWLPGLLPAGDDEARRSYEALRDGRAPA